MLLGGAFLFYSILFANEITYNDSGRRDPFVPLTGPTGGVEGGEATGFLLQGIIYDPGKQSLAIIDGKSYLVGEAIGSAVVKQIQKDQVVVSVDGEDKTLKIREEEPL